MKMNIDEAMKVQTQEEANALLDVLVKNQKDFSEEKRTECETRVKADIGYYAGYFDHETRLRVERLFSTESPFFGKAAEKEITPMEAFEKGKLLGGQIKTQLTSELIAFAADYCKQDQYDKAEAIFESLLNLDPHNWTLLFNLGSTKCLKGQFEEGIYLLHLARKNGCPNVDDINDGIAKACNGILHNLEKLKDESSTG